jgi:CAAX prenyl protease-like protein
MNIPQRVYYRLKKRADSSARRPLWQIGLLFLLLYYLGGTISLGLGALKSDHLQGPVVDSGLYLLFFLPIIYWMDVTLFRAVCWAFPRTTWLGIAAMVLLQCIIEYTLGSEDFSISSFRFYQALIFSPLIEELLRAAMIHPLIQRGYLYSAIFATSLLFALAHAHFWIAFMQCIALALILIKTDYSILAAIAAHFSMNLTSLLIWHDQVSLFQKQ